MTSGLRDHLREELLGQARTGLPVTYKELADRLALAPPRTVHRVTDALEQLMDEDAAAGRPLLAALAVSRARPSGPRVLPQGPGLGALLRRPGRA
jgi:hypothetical protein